MTQLLHTLFHMSLTAAFVAVVVFLLRLVLKGRTARQMVCLLWLLVFARLLIPVTLQSPVSLVPDMELSNSSPVVSTQPESVPTPPVNTSPVVTAPPNVSAPAVTYPVQNPAATIPPNVSAPYPVMSAPVAETPPVEAPAPFPWAAVLTAVWAIGVCAMLIYGVGSYLSIRRKLRFAIRTKEGWWEDPHLRSPFILGLVRPKIYLPCHMAPATRQFILCHEKAHIRRGDHIVKPICWLALALHWFNPLAWVAFLLLSRDIEVACDEKVLREMGSEVKADYSATLLALATNGRFPAPTPLAFGEGDAKTRIKSVLSFKKPALWVTIAAVVIAIVAAVCLLTDPVDKFDPDDYTTQDCYPGLYFERTVVEETGETTVKAYALEDGKPVLVAGWSDQPADNVVILIHPGGEEEVILATRWDITARYEQYLVDYMMEQDENWAQRYMEESDRLVTVNSALWGTDLHAVLGGSATPEEMTDFMGGVAYTPELNLLFFWNGTAQVLPLQTSIAQDARSVKPSFMDLTADGKERLDILWAGGRKLYSPAPSGTLLFEGDSLITYIWDGETWTAHDSLNTLAYAAKPVSLDAEKQVITVTCDPNGGTDIAGTTQHHFSIPEELGHVVTVSISGQARITPRTDDDQSFQMAGGEQGTLFPADREYDLTYAVFALPQWGLSDADLVHVLDLTASMKWNALTEEFDITFTGANSTYTAPDGLTTIGSLPEEDVYLYTDGKSSFWMEAYGHCGPIDILNASAAQLNLSTLADLSKGTATNLSGPDFEIVSFTVQNKHTKIPVSYILMWDGDQNIWDTCPYVTTLSSLPRDIVTGETYPENPEWYYKVAETEQYSLYARNHGAEVLLQYGNFSWTFGNIAHTPHRNLPVMKELDEETVAVISEVNTGTGVNVDELVVYDATLPVATDYRYDWRELAADFNRNNTLTYDKASNSLTLGWNGKTYSSGVLAQDLSVGFALEDGFAGALVATGDQIRFTPNGDGTFTVRMNTSIGRGNNGSFSDYQAGWFWQYADEGSYVYPLSIGITGLDLVWTVRFTGKDFEIVGTPTIRTPTIINIADEAALQAYSAFLTGSRSAVNALSGESFSFSQISRQITPDEAFHFEPTQYALVDLDGNGQQEMILAVPNIGSMVLRFDAEIIYAYLFATRQFRDVKTDGTFSVSGGHADVGICRISFSGRDYEVDEFTGCRKDGKTVSFFVDYQPASEAEWRAAFDAWEQRDGVQWLLLPESPLPSTPTADMFGLDEFHSVLFDAARAGYFSDHTSEQETPRAVLPVVAVLDQYEQDGKLHVICRAHYNMWYYDAEKKQLKNTPGSELTYIRAVLTVNDDSSYTLEDVIYPSVSEGYSAGIRTVFQDRPDTFAKYKANTLEALSSFPAWDEMLRSYLTATGLTLAD